MTPVSLPPLNLNPNLSPFPLPTPPTVTYLHLSPAISTSENSSPWDSRLTIRRLLGNSDQFRPILTYSDLGLFFPAAICDPPDLRITIRD